LINTYDVVYFDAFAPQFQPELWRFEVLNNFCKGLKKGGIFVTYSSKGQVRRDLEKAGIKVEKVPGPPGKREMIRGTKM
jgi:tRNA U34 5-methylaminomethyl-2-thiouridine-forming methyltransferase MnmC